MTKTKKTKRSALDKLNRFWKSLGVERVVIKSPEEHDRIVAEISHLPHIAAAAIVNTASDKSLEFASSGFKDTTRVAASDPGIWRDICITNRKEILKALERYERNIGRLKKLIKNGSASRRAKSSSARRRGGRSLVEVSGYRYRWPGGFREEHRSETRSAETRLPIYRYGCDVSRAHSQGVADKSGFKRRSKARCARKDDRH